MKTKEKMFFSFTNKDIVDFCIQHEFANNTIRFNKSYLTSHNYLQDLEILIDINNKQCKIVKYRCDNKDNEWKLQAFWNLLLLVLDEYNIDLNCKFIVNLNDGVPVSDTYTKFSTFGRHYKSNHIGLPDPLVSGVLTFGDRLKDCIADDILFEKKIDKMIFRGSDTSKIRNNCLNQRLEFCLSHQDSDYIDSKITLYAHYSDDMLKAHNISKNKITAPRTSYKEQLEAKYIIYINGNTVSGDRMIWQMASNSLLVQVKPEDTENDYIWFHSFLNHLNILPTFNEKTFLTDFQLFKDNNDILTLIEQQKYFAKMVASVDFQKTYTKEALLNYNRIYNS